MSFENFCFAQAMPVIRDCGRGGVDYVFRSEDGCVEKRLTQTDFFHAVMDLPDESGINPTADLPHELIMDTYANMPEFSPETQAPKFS